MKNRFRLVLGVILAYTTPGSVGAYANDGATDAAPPGLGSVAAQLRVHLPPAEAALLLGRIEALGSGPSDIELADGTTMSRRQAVEDALGATELPIEVQIQVVDALLLTSGKGTSLPTRDPSLAVDASMPGTLPGALADAANAACANGAARYATLLRAGKADPAGSDLVPLARHQLGRLGINHDSAIELATVRCIERRAHALNSEVPADPAALDVAN